MLRKLTGLAVATMLSAGFGMAAAQAGGAGALPPRSLSVTADRDVIPARACDRYGCRDGVIIYPEGHVRSESGGPTSYRSGYRDEWRWRDRDWRDRRHQRRWEYRVRPRYDYWYVEPRRYVQPRRAYRFSQAHYRWCQARYRSYRAWDNTFQPYRGPRRQCISPYV